MINKKAQSDVIMNFVAYKLPILIILTVFLSIVLKSYYNTGLDTHNTEDAILVKRILYSENLLAFRDKTTQRTYPGIIDLDKFTTEHLEQGIDVDTNNRVAANIELVNLETGESQRAYINEERARTWDDYLTIEGFESDLTIKYVRIYDEGEYYPGIIKILVLNRK